ncbi:hypothetical protein SLEP1_g28919 [Rubroshorea leprosula]|uniref:Cullin N-terminal domain-containing protein n=1 Tax=Rubroshorea leprosula TaxID=152421 RepID=A0AAV5K6A9_9ROSI|nr:hypothetical protein SLEP1_g28919 [Rubroshorea leprosula]
MSRKFIPLDEGMMIMEEAIMKAKKIIEGYPETTFTGEEYMRFYDCVYSMSNHHGSETMMQLYEKFRNSLEESILSSVLPSLINKHGATLLKELVVMWSNYKKMGKWLCRFFHYLDRFFIPQHVGLQTLENTLVSCFRDLVLMNLYFRFLDAALTLIEQQRGGLMIDWALLKNLLDFLLEIRNYGGDNSYEDFEHAILTQASTYYSRLASEWLLYDSSADYIHKAFWCLNQEKRRASQYLNPDLEAKLLQVVKYQLLDQTAKILMEKKEAENCGLVTDYQAVLSMCAGMTLQESSSLSTEEWLSKVMETASHTC